MAAPTPDSGPDLPWSTEEGGAPLSAAAPSPPPVLAPSFPLSTLEPSQTLRTASLTGGTVGGGGAATPRSGGGATAAPGGTPHGRRPAAAAAPPAGDGLSDEDTLAASWAGAAGWSIYFPKEEAEEADECAGRRRAVRAISRFFTNHPAGRALLSAEPNLTWVFPLDMRRLDGTHPDYVPDAALSILRNSAKSIALAPDATLGIIGLAAKRAAFKLATEPPSPPPSGHGPGGGRQAEGVDFHTGPVTLSTRIWPRVRHFWPVTPLRALKGGAVGTYVAVRGTVIRVSATRQQVRSMQFECTKCAASVAANFHDFIYEAPVRCARAPRCRARTFVPLRATAESVDWQKIRLQEILEEDGPGVDGDGGREEGRMPRTVDVELVDDLIDQCIPGDVVTISGIVRVLNVDAEGRAGGGGGGGQGSKSLFYIYLEANDVRTARSAVKELKAGRRGGRRSSSSVGRPAAGADQLVRLASAGASELVQRTGETDRQLFASDEEDDVDSQDDDEEEDPLDKLDSIDDATGAAGFSKRDLEAVKQIGNDPDAFRLLVHSLCPAIYGNEMVKAGLLLSLLGGSPATVAPAAVPPPPCGLGCVRNGPRGAAAAPPDSNGGGSAPSTCKCPRGSDAAAAAASASVDHAVNVRPDIHCLVVGDPGLGKSQMLKAASRLAPRGVYVCGNTSSTVGLTVSVVREAGGDFALEAGALVLGDRGLVAIDEFDKMNAEYAALLEAMEQQSVSVAKAGIVCNLSARTSVVAAANPVGGHYDRSRTVCENLKMPLPLLSRFDLVFVLVDRPDADRDRFISEHVMAMLGRDGGASGARPPRPPQAPVVRPFADDEEEEAGYAATAATLKPSPRVPLPKRLLTRGLRDPAVVDPILPPVFRKYLAYARTYVTPTLSAEAKQNLRQFYLVLRKGVRERTLDTTPVTTRQLESLIRLAQARAKAELRTEVTAEHAMDVVDLMRHSMLDEWTDAKGRVDLSRASGLSQYALVKALAELLHTEAERRRDRTFSMADICRLATDADLPPEALEGLVESLNRENRLLLKGPGRYQLQSSAFATPSRPGRSRR